MELLRDVINQETNEERFSRKSIDEKIRNELRESPDIQEKINKAIFLIDVYMSREYYDSKQKRINQLEGINLSQLVEDIFVGICYFKGMTLFVNAAAQLASRLKWSDKPDAMKTMAELLAIVCETDVFDIVKPDRMSSLMVISNIRLSQQLEDYIEHSTYLPPMVCKPLDLKDNYDSGYLSHKESLVLGKGNHHDGDICLDVLNIMNGVQLSLDIEFLSKVEEEPTFEFQSIEQEQEWKRFKKQSYYFYSLLVSQGNKFYLTHAVDKRGRIYCRGYHITTQGTAFKKAMINLANKEEVTGVPKQFQRN